MDHPTMRGYRNFWLDEEHKRERKEPGFIVDGGELVENTELDTGKSWEDSFYECYDCEKDCPIDGPGNFDEDDYRYCNDCFEPIPKRFKKYTVTLPRKKEPELSDPTDCPRCREVKNVASFVCEDCFRLLSDDDDHWYYKYSDNLIEGKKDRICYPMPSFALVGFLESYFLAPSIECEAESIK